MTDQQLLHICLREIEKKAGWGSSEEWTNNEFTQLSNALLRSTGISISVSSLRRLYGKPLYKNNYNPQLETKNALAKYLGYTDWHEFRLKKAKRKQHLSLSPKLKYSFAFLSLAALVLFGLLLFRNYTSANPTLKTSQPLRFEGENLVNNKVPNTVVINYNVKNMKRPLFIDWGDTPTDGSNDLQWTLLEQDSGSITHTYFSKDVYRIRLRNEKSEVLSTLHSAIFTNGWECYVQQQTEYLRVDSLHFHKNDSVLSVTTNYLQQKGINSIKPYRLYYRNNAPFHVDGENYRFQVDFRPEFRDDYIECAHVQIELIGKKGSNLLTFMNEGCAGELEVIYLNNVHIRGNTNNLTAFTVANHKWHTFQMTVNPDSTYLQLNSKDIFKHSSSRTIGEIIGIRFEFLGNGQVRNFDIH